MKLFIDTADIDEIRKVASWGVLDGVTTNPSLFARTSGKTYDEVLGEICQITSGPVSAEVIADDVDGMMREGRHFAKLADNIYVKVPMSETGLEALARFHAEGIRTNCTLIFTANQGLLAAKAGANLLSPFVGRLDDINQDGMIVIRELVSIVEIHELEFRGPRGVDPQPAPRHAVRAGRGAHRDAPLQRVPADDPPPADRQGDRAVPQRLGQGAQGARGACRHGGGCARLVPVNAVLRS